jgi:hypothetical protein
MTDRLELINELLSDSDFNRVGVLTNEDARWLAAELTRTRAELTRVGLVTAGLLAMKHNALDRAT